ncbi:hypothetical protein C0995_003815 [Termitomyces sp. Mi166|nr:hypothetical protein C0995_003815 [Termitomyces sp. Mi166\
MFPVAYLADKLGRRVTIQIGAVIYMYGLFTILGGALQTGARNMDMMLAGRFFAGFGVGFMSDLAPLYQAEIAHPSIRGRLTTLQQFMLGIGAFVASWITYGTSAGLKGSQAEWRVPLGIQIVPALPLIAFILFLPESPRWLAEKGRWEEARQSLARLHANGDINDSFVLAQVKDMKAGIEKARDIGESTWMELFTVPANFRRLALGYILQFSVQMTVVSALQYYSTLMGFTSSRILLFQSINSIIALIGEACCVVCVDHTGRRMPLIVGNVASGLSFVVGSILMARWPGSVHNHKVTPIAFKHIGWKYYLAFAICGHSNALFIWAFFPETTGRPLEQMDILFGDAPLFVPGTSYARVGDRNAGERELREGNFAPGDLSAKDSHDPEKASVDYRELWG